MATIVSCLRYRDARKAISWLGEIFGFERHLVVDGEDGTIVHAELTVGSSMIMLGSVRSGSAYSDLLVQPDEIDRRQTQTIYLAVADADAVHERAQHVGAASSCRWSMRTTEDADSRAATSRGMCGASAPMTLGRRGLPEPCFRHRPFGKELSCHARSISKSTPPIRKP